MSTIMLPSKIAPARIYWLFCAEDHKCQDLFKSYAQTNRPYNNKMRITIYSGTDKKTHDKIMGLMKIIDNAGLKMLDGKNKSSLIESWDFDVIEIEDVKTNSTNIFGIAYYAIEFTLKYADVYIKLHVDPMTAIKKLQESQISP